MQHKEYVLRSTLLIAYVSLFVSVLANGSVYKKFSDSSGVVCRDEYVITNTTMPSLMQCFLKCELKSGCESFDYTENTGLCRGCKSMKNGVCSNPSTSSNYVESSKMFVKGPGYLVSGSSPIPDANFNASSSMQGAYFPHYSRFCGLSWIAKTTDTNQWIQVRFLRPADVVGIYLMSRHYINHHVGSYYLTVSSDCDTFEYYTQDNNTYTILQGVYILQTPTTTTLPKPLENTLCLRLHPVTWTGAISVRFDVIGYYP